nr:MAG TPA: hypothetical protein [Caudoviricetes sp.]
MKSFIVCDTAVTVSPVSADGNPEKDRWHGIPLDICLSCCFVTFVSGSFSCTI